MTTERMTAQDWKFTLYFFSSLAVGYFVTLRAEHVLELKSRAWLEILMSMGFAMLLMIPIMARRDKDAL